MGKSLRSKSKLRAKSIKRSGEFAEFVDARNKRISEKLIESTKKQNEEKLTKQPAEAAEDSMDTDAKKISTSGWRNSRKQQYIQKKLKGKKKGKNATMKF